MDTEDRNHFKTIQNRQDLLPGVSQNPQGAENSNLLPSQAYCLERAKLLFGSYRKDEVHDPDTYCSATALILGLYPVAVVDYVTDPRTGIASDIKWIPNTAEIRSYCNQAAARMAMLAKPTVKFRPAKYEPPLKHASGTSYFEMFEKYGRPLGAFEPGNDRYGSGT